MTARRAAPVVSAAVCFALAAWWASGAAVGGGEEALFRWFNGAGWAWPLVVAPMQLGSIWAVPVVAAAAWRAVGAHVAGIILVVGPSTWLVVQIAKRMLDRPRPAGLLTDVAVRSDTASGLGFPSGHSAVAAAMAAVLVVTAPRAAAPVVLVLAVLVGVARMVAGVHLPADVVGGWALGTTIGLIGARALAERG